MQTDSAFIFPGQGSQMVGMGQALSQAFEVARATFAEADEILGFALSTLCFAGPPDQLTETRNAQPAILTASIAAWRVWQSLWPDARPCCVAGHSLGEYSALVAAGALDFTAAIRLTRVRGELMARAGAARPGKMAAILKLSDDKVATLCAQAAAESGDVVQVANYNAPGQVVISGGPTGVSAALALVQAAGGRGLPLAVSVAAHSALMAPATAEFGERVAATPFRAPQIPIIANITAQPVQTPDEIRAELVGQLTSSVQWTASVRRMADAGATRFVEFGPGEVLTGLVKRIVANAQTANIRTPEDLSGV